MVSLFHLLNNSHVWRCFSAIEYQRCQLKCEMRGGGCLGYVGKCKGVCYCLEVCINFWYNCYP